MEHVVDQGNPLVESNLEKLQTWFLEEVGGKGGPLLMNGPLVSTGNNEPLIGARGGGTKPGQVASFSAGKNASGTFKLPRSSL
ncbi:hypothetical protein P7K49_022353, partial [Saguinus oedipus]